MITYPLIIISLLIIFSYLFDLVSRKTKFPSVLLLLGAGIALQYPASYFGVSIPDFTNILPLLGTIGLILIVLEGALELNFTRQKLGVIRQSFFAAFVILLVTSVGITFLFQAFTGAKFMVCFLNAIPYSVISSAIAIPSVARLTGKEKEFIIYESTFSDILGIMLFNFAMTNEQVDFGSVAQLTLEVVLIVALSVVLCLLLLYLLSRITHNIKFFLIISIIMLIYATGKEYHLPTLIIVLAFGLLLRNASLIEHPGFRKWFLYDNLETDLTQLTQLSAESAFLARTFFFLLFGFTMNLYTLEDPAVALIGIPLIAIIYFARFGYLALFVKRYTPEFFIAPRGLISVLLVFSIPANARLVQVTDGVLFLVILTTSIMVAAGLMGMKNKVVE